MNPENLALIFMYRQTFARLVNFSPDQESDLTEVTPEKSRREEQRFDNCLEFEIHIEPKNFAP